MPYHIDVISNEPLVGKQTLLARVWVDGELRIDAAIPEQLRDTLQRSVPEISVDENPDAFFAALPEHVDYTYMIASAPHVDDECPFGDIGSQPTHNRSGHPAHA